MEYYCEQNVSNPNIDKHNTRTKVLNVLRKVLLGIGIVLFILYVWIGIGELPVSSGAGTILINAVFAIMLLAPFVLAYILIGRRLRTTNSEYDYVLNGGKLKIIRVILRNKRKLMATIQMDCIESIGKITSEAYERFYATKNVKKQYAICNYDDEDEVIYVRYRAEGEDYLLHIEPNEEMLTALKRSLPRLSIVDKSLTVINPIKKQ